MNLVEKIDVKDLQLFDKYRKEYAIYDADGCVAPIEDILQEWSRNKDEMLYKMLGENLIISKEIVCNKTHEELMDKINALLYEDINGSKVFVRALKDYIYTRFTELKLDPENPEFEMYYNMDKLMLEDSLLENTYSGETFFVHFPSGKKYKVQKGCKVSKALGKIAEGFSLPGFEEFRIAHSQILNEKELRGLMYLSIHPLDYATMSDNSYDWSSCMSWTHEGEYRRGTVEMMNSPYVVEAYLAGAEPFEICGGSWNNKKWRELFIVSQDCISGIKGYPYWNRELEAIALKWIKELAEKNLGYTYFDNMYTVYNPSECPTVFITELEKDIEVEFLTNAMYNDCYDNCNMYFGTSLSDKHRYTVFINYSGLSQCMCCGSLESDNYNHEGMLYCDNCDDAKFCHRCGCRIEDDEYYEVDGEYYCRYCYDELPYCDSCNEVSNESNLTTLYLEKDGQIFKWYHVNLCYDCLHYNEYFDCKNVKSYNVPNHWYSIKYISLSDFDLSDPTAKDYVENLFDISLDRLGTENEWVWTVQQASTAVDF